MIDDRKGEGRFWATVVLAFILTAGLALRSGVPSALDETAPDDEFSAARARAALARILGDELAHPTGSEPNRAVMDRVVQEFRTLGYEPVVEETLVCDDSGRCAIVRNVVAELTGRQAGPAVLLNAHYDSVPAAPGAADDGAGVAALIETARALKLDAQPERTIRFLVDDGEEIGLFGAEAFVRARSRDETLAVVVLEARGSSGPVLLFETNRGNLPLVRAYARAVSDPSTSSVFFSIYERLPNRTNFTVFKREGYTGFAAAFIEDPAHYHTPADNLARLSDESLQHMGDLTLSMARELSTHGLAEPRVTASYFDLVGLEVIYWPEDWNIWMSVAGLLLVSLVGIVAIRRERASALQILLGWLAAAIVVAVSAGLGWAIWKLAMTRAAGGDWIASGGVLALAAWLVAAGTVATPYLFLRRAPRMLSIWSAIWLIQGILAVVASRLLPGAAYLFFVPTMVAGLTGLLSLGGRRPERNEGMMAVPFMVSMLLVVPIVEGLYVGLGLVALPAIAGLAGITFLPVMAASTEARRPAMLTMACALGVLVCVVVFLVMPPFDADVPQGLNVVAIQNEAGETSAVLLGSADVVPDSLSGAAEWQKRPLDVYRRPGETASPTFWSAVVDGVGLAAADHTESTYTRTEETGVLRLAVKGTTAGSTIRVTVTGAQGGGEVAYGGHSATLSRGVGERVRLFAVPAEGFVLSVPVKPGGAVEIVEERAGLPGVVRAIAERRGEAELPIGPGDRTIVVSRFDVDSLPSGAEEVKPGEETPGTT